jgi:hypothetical protein
MQNHDMGGLIFLSGTSHAAAFLCYMHVLYFSFFSGGAPQMETLMQATVIAVTVICLRQAS